MDKRLKYNWLIVIIFNLVVFVLLFKDILDPFWSLSIAGSLFITSLLATIIPTLISKSNLNSKIRNIIGYGLPLSLIIPIIRIDNYSNTCDYDFCGLTGLWVLYLGYVAIVFVIFYILGALLRRKPQ